MSDASTIDNKIKSGPAVADFVELLKPITWFPPMWALMCGLVSAGATPWTHSWAFIAGLLLTGPLVCGASQIVNDWFDREVDAINEPNRPIPSGRVPGSQALWFAVIWTVIAQLWSLSLGSWVAGATAIALVLAWMYSAPPFRLKQNGWWGNLSVGITYEGLAWVTGAAIALGGTMPPSPVLIVALLYSLGAHGIMTLNDFKSVEGDRQMGVKSLPAQLGTDRAAKLACAVMALPQLVVIALLIQWQLTIAALVVGLVVGAQAAAMVKLLAEPEARAPWYNATGVSLYVSGMMVSAIALGGHLA